MFYNIVFAVIAYENDENAKITITNHVDFCFDENKKDFLKYYNLSAPIKDEQKNNEIIKVIEETCSNFFPKIRSKYVLIIENGQIGLGLKNATFGKVFRILNKQKTKRLTEEAMQEIEEFMLNIKEILESKN